ncbi:MAG TPA: MiaB/RimO family radical SAM methylthiotransferase [Mycobacteriales bacterium]|nr:MiaB/RimO family radical SAM methylthiotransferase [Mycobacteriales bacterium]
MTNSVGSGPLAGSRREDPTGPLAGSRREDPTGPLAGSRRRAQVVTLGCARNEVDSEEIAARLAGAGWEVTGDQDGLVDGAVDSTVDVVLVNTCGFVAAAKKDSVDTLLAATDAGVPVVAVGCLAERYGEQLAAELPEAAAVLGFDAYAELPSLLDRIAAGERVASHTPSDRRRLLPVVPTERPAAVAEGSVPVPGGSRLLRRRLETSVVAPLKIASGCDRRCAFCAIPSFRGAFVSRHPDELVDEAAWLAAQGVRELVLVSENSTSYGKDLGDVRALEGVLPRLAAVDGIVRVRVAYLQPAEMRPSLVEVITGTPGVAAYADLSFQHASPTLLRRMRRFGGTDAFLGLLDDLRRRAPRLGARSNVIVGFPGETDDDVAELERFLTAARLDAVGVFGYSDEDGTEGATLDGHVDEDEIAARVEQVTALADELCAQRAEERIGEVVEVLVESVEGGLAEGRAEHQQPDVDGGCVVRLGGATVAVGDLVRATVVASEGVDLVCDLAGDLAHDLARDLARDTVVGAPAS